MAGMQSPLRLPVGRSSDFILHIYSYNHWILMGRVSHVQSGQSMVFHSMMEMILAVQQKLDDIGFPQSTTATRTWKVRKNASSTYRTDHNDVDESPDVAPDSILASFLVRIQFRQNSTWQGTVVWMEHKESCSFRSVLELVTLVAEALDYSKEPGPGDEAHFVTKNRGFDSFKGISRERRV